MGSKNRLWDRGMSKRLIKKSYAIAFHPFLLSFSLILSSSSSCLLLLLVLPPPTPRPSPAYFFLSCFSLSFSNLSFSFSSFSFSFSLSSAQLEHVEIPTICSGSSGASSAGGAFLLGGASFLLAFRGMRYLMKSVQRCVKGKAPIESTRLKQVWDHARKRVTSAGVDFLVLSILQSIQTNLIKTGRNGYSKITPAARNRSKATASRTPSVGCPIEASIPVTHVPTLAPSISPADDLIVSMPCPARERRILIVAPED
mmetsp:Transcript_9897/g.19313  ORF Transcript_9897/g.19313 Transcript_9897/m.19313 type:complete len:256 (-) Transcript_9897:827-1594(-)